MRSFIRTAPVLIRTLLPGSLMTEPPHFLSQETDQYDGK